MLRNLLIALACASASPLFAPAAAQAQTLASEPVVHRTIHVPRDKSLSFRLPGPATRIVVAQPEIAKVTATSDSTFYVQGIELGSTDLLVYGPGGRLVQVIDVRVGFDPNGLAQDLAAIFPKENIRVRAVGERLLLEGEVSNAGVIKEAREIAEQYAEPGAITSNLQAKATQVILQVRVLEVSRSAAKDFGVNLAGTGDLGNHPFSFATGSGLLGNEPATGAINLRPFAGSFQLDVNIKAMEDKGLVRTLARPNLVAISGQKATFLAGGEFPYPVPQNDRQITLEFKTYGVKLEFQPDMMADGRIRLAVAPEVSQIDPANSLRISDFTIPALTTRRASTTVELKPGEALAIGGLLQRDYMNGMRQFPFLGDIPYLSALFRSSQWRRNETELVIIVTPTLVTDAEKAAAAAQVEPPGSEPSSSDIALRGKSLDRPLGPEAH